MFIALMAEGYICSIVDRRRENKPGTRDTFKGSVALVDFLCHLYFISDSLSVPARIHRHEAYPHSCGSKAYQTIEDVSSDPPCINTRHILTIVDPRLIRP